VRLEAYEKQFSVVSGQSRSHATFRTNPLSIALRILLLTSDSGLLTSDSLYQLQLRALAAVVGGVGIGRIFW
jgi:hypothetical protein